MWQNFYNTALVWNCWNLFWNLFCSRLTHVLSHVINYQPLYYLSTICTMIYCSFNDMLNYSGVITLSCFSYFGLCCCPQRSPIPRSVPRVFQVTRTTTAWVPSALAHCWAPSQLSSSTPTQRPCWDAPYRPRGFRSWRSSWRTTPPWGQGPSQPMPWLGTLAHCSTAAEPDAEQ